MVVSSPQRLLSRRSLRHSGRRRHGSASESDGESILAKQVSLDQQVSMVSDRGFHGSTTDLKRKTLEKQQEEWDKDIPKVGWCRELGCIYQCLYTSVLHTWHILFCILVLRVQYSWECAWGQVYIFCELQYSSRVLIAFCCLKFML